MTNKRSTIISLTGGLGNQLFQLAAGLYVTQGEDLQLTNYFGRPRATLDNIPDLLEFEGIFGGNEFISAKESNFLSRKSVGYLLRSGIDPRKWEESPVAKGLTRFAASILTSFSIGGWRRVFEAKHIGFEPQLSTEFRGRLLIGYFQSYIYASNQTVLEKLRSLSVKSDSLWLKELQEVAKAEEPIILHVRLTDYVDETFGILTTEYYEKALYTLRSQGADGRVWIFSDDIKKALQLLPTDMTKEARIITDPENSSTALVLEAMRLGHHYVIANSTFSWWGAFLSHNQPIVAYPNPWFVDGSVIQDLCPPEWLPISR